MVNPKTNCRLRIGARRDLNSDTFRLVNMTLPIFILLAIGFVLPFYDLKFATPYDLNESRQTFSEALAERRWLHLRDREVQSGLRQGKRLSRSQLRQSRSAVVVGLEGCEFCFQLLYLLLQALHISTKFVEITPERIHSIHAPKNGTHR